MDRYDGFHEFVLGRGTALSRLAYLLCGNHGTAEELVQSAQVRVAARPRGRPRLGSRREPTRAR